MELEVSKTFDNISNAYDSERFRYIVSSGGSRCFHGDQIVVCKSSLKKISDICFGDVVLTMNESTGLKEWKKVNETLKFIGNRKRMIKLTLKNGHVIKCTEDHKIFYNGGWVSAKDILSLINDRNMETITSNAI